MAIVFDNQVVAGVVLIRDAIQSQNFAIADDGTVTGWQIASDGSSTFTSTTISGPGYGIDNQGVGSFSAVNVDTDIFLAGESLDAILADSPQGMIAFGDSSVHNTTGAPWTVDGQNSGASEISGAEFDFADIDGSRYYKITMGVTMIGTAASSLYNVQIRFTNDGTAPGPGVGAVFDGSLLQGQIPTASPFKNRHYISFIYTPPTSYNLIRMMFTYQKTGGTGFVFPVFSVADSAFQIWVEDMGPQVAANGGNQLSQASKQSGSPDPPPPATYTKTYQANWSRTWNNGGSQVNVTNGEIDQGYISGFGNRISWIGFPFSTIQSDLSGATVKKVEVYLKYYHWYNNSGGTSVIGTHSSTATSAPSYNAGLDNQNRKQVSGWAANSAKWVDITSVVGSEFKTGASTGIVIGQGPSTNAVYYGKAYGNTQGGEPALRITYTK